MSTTSATPPTASDAFRPVITITALARLVYDSWLNGPHKPIFFPPHLQANPLPLDIGLPKKTPLSSSSVTPSAATSPSTASSTSSSLQPPEQQQASVIPPPKSEKEILREIFKNACWLSNVLHHAMIEAAALGYDIRTSKDNKRVVKFWVFEGEKVNPNEVAHSWNVFQVEDISSACDAATPSLQPPSFCCVDLTIDQFKDSSRLDVPENLITPGFGVLPGTTRLKPDLFKSAGPSKNWIGKEIVVNDVDEIEATTLLWEYFISLLQSHAALAFPGVIPATPPPPRRKSKKKPSATTSPMVVPVSPGQVILQFPAPPKEEVAQISPENKKKYKKEIAQIEVEVGLFIESCKCLCGNANVDANVGLRAKSFLFSFMEAGVLKTRDLLEP